MLPVRPSLVLAAALTGVVMVSPARAADPAIGHRVERIEVPGVAAGEVRQVDVHLWYPATDAASKPQTVYTSALHGQPLPNGWAPLSWSVDAELAHEDATFDAAAGPYAPIVFSHGANNDPIDYAHTLEAIAAAGFVVAAPTHTNNTQDDVRRDYLNALAKERVFDCQDGLPHSAVPTLNANGFPSADCAKGPVPASMVDRVRDVGAVLDHLAGWFGDAVAPDRAGVLGHSRGTVTALAVAGGSTTWGTPPDPRVHAIMGMAIGAMAINNGVNLANVTAPTLLVSGNKDRNTQTVNTAAAYELIPDTTDKTHVDLPWATHRSFDSTYCAQLQSAGAALAAAGATHIDDPAALNRPLDRWNVPLIASSFPGGISGKAVHYCAPEFFAGIERLVASVPNAEYACDDSGCDWIPPLSGATDVCAPGVTTPPCTTLDTDAVQADITARAVSFFGPRLDVRAPTIHVANVTANATGPTGATVSYSATATDDVDPHPQLTCAPASGARFAIGTTTVSCTATDARGNRATKTFTVTVLGAGAQVANLLADVIGAHNVSPALRALLTGLDPSRPAQRTAVCVALHTFGKLVRLLAPIRTAWIADADRIRAVLVC
jgi:predicted dienelactone hydrolase